MSKKRRKNKKQKPLVPLSRVPALLGDSVKQLFRSRGLMVEQELDASLPGGEKWIVKDWRGWRELLEYYPREGYWIAGNATGQVRRPVELVPIAKSLDRP